MSIFVPNFGCCEPPCDGGQNNNHNVDDDDDDDDDFSLSGNFSCKKDRDRLGYLWQSSLYAKGNYLNRSHYREVAFGHDYAWGLYLLELNISLRDGGHPEKHFRSKSQSMKCFGFWLGLASSDSSNPSIFTYGRANRVGFIPYLILELAAKTQN